MSPDPPGGLKGMCLPAPFPSAAPSPDPGPGLPGRTDARRRRRPCAAGPDRPPGPARDRLLLGGLSAAPLFLGLPAVQQAVRDTDRPSPD
jgi:hypothetical protein